jgi:2',3'-cyclic-nucleotide 2'-phosphodiesterase (5'-nucleotidase family)
MNRSKQWISIVLTAILLLAMVVPNVSANTEPISLAKWDFSSTTNKLVATSGIESNLDKTLSVVGPTITANSGGPTTGVTVPNATPWNQNPAYWTVSLSTKGYENITLSSKQYSSNTGPRDFKVQYSLDNTTWVDVPGATATVAANWTSGVLSNVALPSEANNLDLVYVRWIKTSETGANGSPLASTGTSRIGEIEFNATAIQTTTEPQPDPNAIPGQGTLLLDEAPLANTTFSLYETTSNQWYDFTSNENGVYTHNLADGTYKVDGIWVSPTWYVLGQTFTIKNGLVNGLQELKIDALNYEIPAEATANVKGSVTNGTAALKYVPFSIQSSTGDWIDTKTDKNGNFALQLADGSYTLAGIWSSALNKWYELGLTFTVENGQLQGQTNLIIDLATVAAENVTGTITKGATPVANTTFSIRTGTGTSEKWYSTTTDANGNYSLRLPNGTYTIEGIWSTTESKWYVLQKDFTVNGNLQLNINVLTDGPVDLTPNVTGKVAKGKQAVPNVVFSVHTTGTDEVKWYDLSTDKEGNFSTILPNGTYMLEGIWLDADSKWYSLQKEFTVTGAYELNIDVIEGQFALSIMHTNDTHANLDNATNKINVAKKMTAINSVRTANPSALLLDAGDVLSGTLYFNEYKGQADLEFMNLARYDAMTFGNHEFDLGTSVLADFVKNAQFPLVSANVNFANDANLKANFNDNTTEAAQAGQIYNGIVKTINGEKVGIFGLTTVETPTISSPGADVVFENYIEEAQKSVDAFEALGVNKIIALSHLGYDDSTTWDNDKELAKAVDGIDVIVGGHTHTKLDAPVFDLTGDEPTVIVQANEYNKFLGTLNVRFDENGKVITEETKGKLLDISTYSEDAATLAVLNTKYKPVITAKEQTIVGTAAVQLVGGNPAARVGETNLGNFIADGMLAKAKIINPETLIAVQNGGGVRTTLPAGNITLADVFKVLPFGNSLGIMNLKGSEIKEALEHAVKDAPTAFGGFLQISGMKFTYDSTKAVGSKVVSVKVKGNDGVYTDLDLTKNYFVATNVFTAKGGDGFSMFGKAYTEGRVSEPGFVDWEMFQDYIAAQPNKTVSPQVEGRIVNVAPLTVPAASFSGTVASPKVYNGNVIVDVTGVAKLEYATVKGNLKLIGNTNVELFNVTVEGETLFE